MSSIITLGTRSRRIAVWWPCRKPWGVRAGMSGETNSVSSVNDRFRPTAKAAPLMEKYWCDALP
jgi:hypothetical protein